jgi:hypothetical protein
MALSPPMRAVPTVTLSGVLYIYDGTAVAGTSSVIANYSTEECIEFDIALISPLTAGRPAIVFVASQGGYVDVSSEL